MSPGGQEWGRKEGDRPEKKSEGEIKSSDFPAESLDGKAEGGGKPLDAATEERVRKEKEAKVAREEEEKRAKVNPYP